MKKITVPFYISHKGCPHTCIFCDQRIISGSAGSLPSTGEILEKITTWSNSSGGRPVEVAFFGGTFTLLPHHEQQRLLGPLQPLIKVGAVASVRISTRPDAIDTQHVGWLAELGVSTIELGVQSMDDTVLAAAGRGHDAATSIAALTCIRRAGLSAGAQLMPGLPGDTFSASLSSLEQVISAGACFVRIYPVVVLRDTELAQRYQAGRYAPLSVETGVSICKIMLQTAMKAPVDVIRIGLQADESLSSDNVLAGCWHPAFGQLVYSELYFDLLVQLVAVLVPATPIQVKCHPSRISDVIGHKRKNLLRLLQLQISIEAVLPDKNMMPGEIIVSDAKNEVNGSIIKDLKYDINRIIEEENARTA